MGSQSGDSVSQSPPTMPEKFLPHLCQHQLFHFFLISAIIDAECPAYPAAKSCSTLCDPMNWRLPGFPVHGISPARILKWVAISFSRGSSRTRDRTLVSCIGRQVLYHWATRKSMTDGMHLHFVIVETDISLSTVLFVFWQRFRPSVCSEYKSPALRTFSPTVHSLFIFIMMSFEKQVF